MSDSESLSGIASSSARKEPQNEACTACRAVKRRCHNEGKGSICTRCQKQGLECLYAQMKRGRKPGSSAPRKRRAGEDDASAVGPDAGTAPRVGEASGSTAGLPQGGPAQGPGGDWLLADLLQTEAESSAGPSSSYTPTNTGFLPLPAPPPTSAAPAAYPPFVTMSGFPQVQAQHATQHQPNGTSPAASYQSANSVAGAAPSPNTPHAVAAAGGFSLSRLLKENQPNGEGEEAEPLRHSLADAFAPRTARAMAKKPEKTFADIVETGILPESQVDGLFNFYFAHLNPMTSLLDPALHTVEFCRSRSPFLFTAILTVATKVAHQALYPSSLQYAKALLGQAFEAGTNNLELVQALATLVFWQDPEDPSGARKLAYAIRCAFELNIHKKGRRPLPEDEMDLRKALNPERTWLYLTIADHRFSTQRGLPKMIDNSYRSDAIPWLLEHDSQRLCPQSAGLAPLIELGRILDTFAVLIAPEDGLPSLELLRCLERDVESWRSNWSLERASLPLQPAQASLVRFYGAVLQFQLLELNLHISIKRASALDSFDPRTDARSSPLVVFGGCIKSAIRVLDIMERELRFMVYSFDSMWVGAASASIWLAQNLSGMEPPDRAASLSALNRLQAACSDVSSGPQSMAAYTSRLLLHLLQKVQDGEAAAAAAAASELRGADVSAQQHPAAGPSTPAQTHAQAPSFVKASLSAPSWSIDPSASASGGMGVFTAGGGGAGFGGGGGAPSGGSSARRKMLQPMWATPGGENGTSELQQQAFDALGVNFLGTMMPPVQSFGEDLPFPAADDAFWQSLFPLSFEST
ncbi:hypothetical protein JCM3770_004435 [Rhodotorula araucariae]